MSARTYTSSEMLEVAEALQDPPAASSRDAIGADARCLIPTAVDMLRQAAGILTRVQRARARVKQRNAEFQKVWGADDSFDGNAILDYIWRGM